MLSQERFPYLSKLAGILTNLKTRRTSKKSNVVSVYSPENEPTISLFFQSPYILFELYRN